MKLWTRSLGALALAAACAAALPALADEPGRAAAGTSLAQRPLAVVTVVRARDLITPAERQAYREAMRAAKTPEERQRIRDAAVERLSQRAAEHGVIMVIDAPMIRYGQRPTEPRPAPGR